MVGGAVRGHRRHAKLQVASNILPVEKRGRVKRPFVLFCVTTSAFKPLLVVCVFPPTRHRRRYRRRGLRTNLGKRALA